MENKDLILVVDDESIMRKLIKDFLIASNFEVIEAGDGEEAVKVAHEKQGGYHAGAISSIPAYHCEGGYQYADLRKRTVEFTAHWESGAGAGGFTEPRNGCDDAKT